MGLTNVEVMIPFVRTVAQAESVVAELAKHDLKRGENGLKVIMMCENSIKCFTGRSILLISTVSLSVPNDMTQLTLGLDRDSGVVSELFDERNDAVKPCYLWLYRLQNDKTNM